MHKQEPFYIQKGSIFAVPILHYKMEMAAQVRLAFEAIQPDCVAVELGVCAGRSDYSVLTDFDDRNKEKGCARDIP